MRARFEEKSYEGYFNIELANKADVFFPLGQVQEGFLGFDSSAFVKNRGLWKRLGFPYWFKIPFVGVPLQEIADEMEFILDRTIDSIPQIKSNLLFQYKKPEYITVNRGREWRHWNEPYYRYDIYQEQQELLMNIENRLSDKVFVAYASPALHKVDDLVKAYLNEKIIGISNFCRASDLNGHRRNTYTNSGRYSIACSEPERIDNLNLIDVLNSFDNNKIDSSNRDFIIDFREKLVSITSESQYYGTLFHELNEQYSKVKQYKLFYSHLVLNNFKQLTGIQWLGKL